MEKSPNLKDISDLIFFTNQALQHEIRPNMRQVSVKYIENERKFILYLYYDKPMSQKELDYDVSGKILTKISSYFENVSKIEWEGKVIVLPYPARLPNERICVYCRYEPSPDNE